MKVKAKKITSHSLKPKNESLGYPSCRTLSGRSTLKASREYKIETNFCTKIYVH